MDECDVLCLANSFKRGGRCIAGLMRNGTWIRPVSGLGDGELHPNDYLLDDGSEPQVGDVIRVPLSDALPNERQPENWAIRRTPWRLIERPAAESWAYVVRRALNRRPSILGCYRTKIPVREFQIRPAKRSLEIVAPSRMLWHSQFNSQNQQKARVMFWIGERQYDLPLTDPNYVASVKSMEDGVHEGFELGLPDEQQIYLTISLSEPVNGLCYKLVAAVILFPASWPTFCTRIT